MLYKLFPFFIFRTPLLANESFSLYDRDVLFRKFTNPQVQEAIYLASPVLYREIQKILNEKKFNTKEIERIAHSFYRYLIRMQTRCTPFGLFAGCGFGEAGNDTLIHINKKFKRKTRLDMLFLCALYDAIIQMPDIRAKVKYYPNSSIYPLHKKFRYAESVLLPSGLKYQLSETDQSSHLKKILKVADKGADMDTLVNSLVSDANTKDDVMEFINDLIDAQVLSSELYKAITGSDFFDRIICLIESINENNRELPILKEMRMSLTKLDNDVNVNTGIDTYQHIHSLVKQINIPYEEQFLFQVDMTREASVAYLGNDVIEELKSTMTFLNRIQVSRKNDLLERFCQDFYQRYEEKEVPLMEALDSELGVGYPSRSNDGDLTPLIDDFALIQEEEERVSYSNKFHTILYSKAMECLALNRQEILLIDNDFKDFSLHWNDLYPTIFTLFEIIRAVPDDVLIKLNFFSGSGANLLARFAHADEKIDAFVKEITEKEQSLTPNVVLAEIVHLPEARISNVLFRPHIRDYEIVYLSSSDLPQEQIIHVSDLMLSVRNNRIILRSKRLGKVIIPQLTTAHVYHFGLPVYRFLCDMQKQSGRFSLFFDWGAYPHYFRPRVRYKNTILSPATWLMEKNKMKHLYLIQEDDSLITAVDVWRKQHQIPRYVLMGESENKLWVDWENALSIRSMFSIIKNHPFVTFTEFLFEPEHAVVRDSDGNAYTNECIAVFYREPE